MFLCKKKTYRKHFKYFKKLIFYGVAIILVRINKFVSLGKSLS